MASLVREPEDYARLLLSQLNITHVGELNEVLNPLRLTVHETDATSFEGALVCRKDRSKGIIVLNTKIDEEGRKRFTVCHEVGHFILPGHGQISCRSTGLETYRASLAPQEVEANRVASELLLPTKLIYPIVTKKKATIALAKELGLEFQTSLTATVYKLVKVTEERCAIVWSADGAVRWFDRNEYFRQFVSLGLLDEQTVASRLFKDRSVREADGFVYAESWLIGDGLSGRIKLWEDSIYLPNFNSVLSILTLDS
jgi:hypothetical protein